MLFKSFRVVTPLFLIILLLSMLPSVYAATFVVHPGDSQGWIFWPCGASCTNGTIPPAYENGPATPPIGEGSLTVELPLASSKILFGRQDYEFLPLSELEVLSFSTYVDPTATSTDNFYLNVYIDTNNDDIRDVRLDYVPENNGTVLVGVWQTWDAADPASVYRNGGSSVTLANFMAANPNARIIRGFPTAENYPGIIFNMGDTAANYQGFVGNFDNVTIETTGGGSNTWDFELDAPVPPPDITVSKTADADGDTFYNDNETGDPGGFVRYHVTVSNVGGSDVTVTSISDSPAHAFNETCASFVGTVIPSGNSASCTFTGTLPNGYDASHTDTITVTAQNSALVSDSASDSTTVYTTATIAIEVPACDDASNRSSTYSDSDKLSIGNNWVSGIRFCDFPFDDTDEIVSVQLQLVASGPSFPFTMQIGFQNANNAQPFAASPSGRLPSNRNTVGNVIWNQGAWSANTPYLSPDLNSSLQQVFDRPGYDAGKDVAVIVRPLGSAALHQAWSIEAANAELHPVLIVRVPADFPI